MNVLVNTTVLSNFAVVDRLDLLHTLFGTLYVAQAVLDEVQGGIDEGYSFYTGIESAIYPYCEAGWLHLATIEGERELDLFQSLPRKRTGAKPCLWR